jgi:hypothetical protein
MKHMLLLSGLMLLLPALAIAAPHRVKIVTTEKDSPVVAALNARLNATERYQIIEEGEPDLVFAVACMGLEKYHITGSICSYTFLFVPSSAPTLWMPIGDPGLLGDSEPSLIAEELFQLFKATTEREINKAESKLQNDVSLFCSKAENERFCKLK